MIRILSGIILNNACLSSNERIQAAREAPVYFKRPAKRRAAEPEHTAPEHANDVLRKEFTMEEQVLKAMKEAGKPVRPGDIAKVLGVDSKEVSKACAELKKAGKIYSPKRCYYEPVAE